MELASKEEYLHRRLNEGKEANCKYHGSGQTNSHGSANCKNFSFVTLCADFNPPSMMKSQISNHRIEGIISTIYRPAVKPHIGRATKKTIFFILDGNHEDKSTKHKERPSDEERPCFLI